MVRVRHLVAGIAMLVAASTNALANGRPAGTSTINFRQGNEQHIVAGMTFGLLTSKDGGATWHWFCEAAIKYGGMYDPDYAYSSTGALFATTFDGMLVNRDGCNFDYSFFGMGKFVSTVAQASNGTLYAALAHPANPTLGDPGDAKIYRSDNNGVSYVISADPGQINDWWSSIEVAPNEPTRVYLTGYRLAGSNRTILLFKSVDAGLSYTPMQLTGLTLSKNSTVEIVGISQANPDHLYVRVTFQNELTISDGIYRSTDRGDTWQNINNMSSDIAFVRRGNGDLVVGTKQEGAFVSRSPSNGDVWEALPTAPHINCLVENTAGEVWACTQNFGSPGVPSDMYGIMKSTDLATWTPVLRYQDILGPESCPAGTLQDSECVAPDLPASPWCTLRMQIGVTADPTMCPSVMVDGPPPDAPIVGTPNKPCCSAGDAQSGILMFGLVAIGLHVRRRRRR